VFSQWFSGHLCHVVDVCSIVSEEHTVYILILTVWRMWMLKWRECRNFCVIQESWRRSGLSEVVKSQWE